MKLASVRNSGLNITDMCYTLEVPAYTLFGAWDTNLEVRPEQDWKELKGRAVTEE